MTRLSTDRLSLGYADRTVVHEVDVAFPDAQVTAIVGANACGKSTLLRGLARLVPPTSGFALLDGNAIHTLPTRDIARQVGLLPQSPLVPEGVTVADLVSRGRHPHQGLWRRWSASDEAALADALALTGTGELADRPVDELSGGQRLRVWLAVALAQETPLLLLDEPTTYLDLAHQIAVLDLLRDLNRTRGTTLVMVLHDLGLAARYADHVVALREGRVHAAGSPYDVVTEDMVRDVLGLECRVVPDPVAGTPLIVPVGRHVPVPVP
jgi:iron complex transport system ATP-binding protein